PDIGSTGHRLSRILVEPASAAVLFHLDLSNQVRTYNRRINLPIRPNLQGSEIQALGVRYRASTVEDTLFYFFLAGCIFKTIRTGGGHGVVRVGIVSTFCGLDKEFFNSRAAVSIGDKDPSAIFRKFQTIHYSLAT